MCCCWGNYTNTHITLPYPYLYTTTTMVYAPPLVCTWQCSKTPYSPTSIDTATCGQWYLDNRVEPFFRLMHWNVVVIRHVFLGRHVP